ncbi:methyltransferase domain-containing protein [Blastochloris sulfoviridis]|uniref:Methyltransferase domain-containing protein n=1 Tax=Blastochloris sulfoviridis TaxID=50712 RepID=A0A5M6HQY2_9HYPH|nr:methyltransferase domain-containing protein [Blastochloris sulfoviridis]KAA5598283.1 methyltransferase domain-containing protein [Blastochloris sulfoviridis]
MAAPVLFDRALIRCRRARAVAMGPADFLLDMAAEDLADRLAAVARRFAAAADIGTPGDAAVRALTARGQVEALAHIDLLAGADTLPDGDPLPLAPASLDLAVSALALQFVNDLPGLLVQVRRALKPDGLFLAALVGGDSLTELRQAFMAAEAETAGGASPRVAPFAGVREMGALLQRAGFALPVADVDRLTVRYATPLALMAELRRMGAANPLAERRRAPLRRDTLARAVEIYAERFADPDGRVRATFEIVWVSGWAPHDSQQTPLKPGSAQMRLADALAQGRAPKPGPG